MMSREKRDEATSSIELEMEIDAEPTSRDWKSHVLNFWIVSLARGDSRVIKWRSQMLFVRDMDQTKQPISKYFPACCRLKSPTCKCFLTDMFPCNSER